MQPSPCPLLFLQGLSIFILYFHVGYCRQLTEKELPDSYVLFQDAFNRSKKMSDGKTFVALQININRVFTDEQEKHIEEYAIKIARMLYGLPVPEFRKLVTIMQRLVAAKLFQKSGRQLVGLRVIGITRTWLAIQTLR